MPNQTCEKFDKHRRVQKLSTMSGEKTMNAAMPRRPSRDLSRLFSGFTDLDTTKAHSQRPASAGAEHRRATDCAKGPTRLSVSFRDVLGGLKSANAS